MTDTIVALATPNSESALSVIRVSGELCKSLAKHSCAVPSPTPRHAYFTKYTSSYNEVVDQIVVVFFEQPKSFTGEDTLEITCHGNPIIIKEIISDLIVRGCRMATPGEFSYKAFNNGKIDLTQAEAIAELIGAKNKRAISLASKNLEGKLSEKINLIQATLLEQQSRIEAFIDFPEDDLGEDQTDKIIIKLQSITNELENLIGIAKKIDAFNRTLKVSLVGPPNAGKSSLFNKIIGSDRALVDKVEGTTRDYIDQMVNLGSVTIQLHDTAGLRDTTSTVEKKGINKTKELVESTDLVLLVLDSSAPYPSGIESEIINLNEANTILVLNKSDLKKEISLKNSFVQKFEQITTSVKNVESIELLNDKIETFLSEKNDIYKEFNLFVNQRQSKAINQSKSSVENSINHLRLNQSIEFAVSDLKDSIDFLGEIVGKKDNEDMLDTLFSTFCIGK